jgi:hypothetical protein
MRTRDEAADGAFGPLPRVHRPVGLVPVVRAFHGRTKHATSSRNLIFSQQLQAGRSALGVSPGSTQSLGPNSE